MGVHSGRVGIGAAVKTVALISRKGGAGKSTFALHLAALASETNPRVIVIDTDEQKSTSKWWESRGRENPALIECGMDKIDQAIAAARKHDFDWVFIDTPPYGSSEIARIAALADICIVPCRPNPIDLDALPRTLEVTGAQHTLVVLNQCPPQRNLRDVHRVIHARRVLVEMGAQVADGTMTSRLSVSHCVGEGRGITEAEPDGAAAEEFRSLWEAVCAMIERKSDLSARVA